MSSLSRCDDIMIFGYYDVNGDVMGRGVDVIDELEIISHAYLCCIGIGEQPVIIAFAATDAVSFAVVCHPGDYNKFDFRYRGDVIALRLLDVK